MKIYSIKDIGMGFSQVFTAGSDYMAKRMLTDTVNDRQPSLITQYPKDFSLYRLGELDQDTGTITPCCEFICEAIEVKKNSQSSETKQA